MHRLRMKPPSGLRKRRSPKRAFTRSKGIFGVGGEQGAAIYDTARGNRCPQGIEEDQLANFGIYRMASLKIGWQMRIGNRLGLKARS